MAHKFLKINNFQEWILTPWGYGTLALITGVLAFTIQGTKAVEDKTPQVAPDTADTYIPAGHTLIPIEITNYESLDSIIGSYGVVDLFTTPLSETEKAKAIAFAVKILRAPNSPSHFAVLVDHKKAEKILRFPGPFSVTVRNPKASGTQFVKTQKQKRKRRIIYDSDEQPLGAKL